MPWPKPKGPDGQSWTQTAHVNSSGFDQSWPPQNDGELTAAKRIMKTKTLALIHTVNWYNKSVNEPFVKPWLKRNPDVRVFNILDDSLLSESLAHNGATPA